MTQLKEDILELEEQLDSMVSKLEKEHGVVLTSVVIQRPDVESVNLGDVSFKTQWIVASDIKY